MERTNSTVDKHSMCLDNMDNFTELKGIALKDMKVFIFMKPNTLRLDPYIMHVIEYLQKFNIVCYVIEEVMDLLKAEIKASTEEPQDVPTNERKKIPMVDLDKLELFIDASQTRINRLITLGGDGTVVQAIKLFYKDKCPIMITFSEESIGYLC